MTETLRNASVAVQIVAYGYCALLVGALAVLWGGAVVSRLTGKSKRVPNPFAALIGVAVLFGIPGGLAAAMALVVSPLLVAMPLPVAGWVLIGGLSLWGFYEASVRPSGGMEGCTQLFIAAFAGFGLCWAGAALLLANPPVGDAASFVRPLLVAAPLAIFIGTHTRRHPVKQAIGFALLFAILAAIAFLPVESGFAQTLLPASDWLRFPIMGALVFGFWPLLSIPLTLLFSSRAIRWENVMRAVAGLAIVGGLFGLVWAVTRLLF